MTFATRLQARDDAIQANFSHQRQSGNAAHTVGILYERLVARLFAEQLSTDLCVTPNARIKGHISGRSRQIDVLIDARGDTDRRSLR